MPGQVMSEDHPDSGASLYTSGRSHYLPETGVMGMGYAYLTGV